MQTGLVEYDVDVIVREVDRDTGLSDDHKDVLFVGPPGYVCVVLKLRKEIGPNHPTKGIAWGLFDDRGEFRVILDTRETPHIMSIVYKPHMVTFFEKNWCQNTEA